MQCATVANSISASASPVSASFKNHHYRRGVFQFFFRNQTISNSELAVQKTDPTQRRALQIAVVVGDKRCCHGSVKWIVISGKDTMAKLQIICSESLSNVGQCDRIYLDMDFYRF